MMYLTQAERAWAAGLFDGEGSVDVARMRNYKSRYQYNHQLRARVTICHRLTVERLQSFFGGSARTVARLTTGGRRAWIWSLNGAPLVARFLREVYPFSVTKRQQISIALDAAMTWRADRPRDNVWGNKGMPEELFALREGYYLALREAKRAFDS